jgi:HPr kinase/phosphorylase
VSDTSGDPDSGSGGDVARVVHPAWDAGMPIPSLQAASLPTRVSPDWLGMQIHGSCASRDGNGVLLIGPPGAGKSDLVLRLLARGFDLVADDRVDIADGVARPVPALVGLLEVRGLGIVLLRHVAAARLALVVDLGDAAERLPAPMRHDGLNLPMTRLDAREASAPERVSLALDCALGRIAQVAGAFAT